MSKAKTTTLTLGQPLSQRVSKRKEAKATREARSLLLQKEKAAILRRNKALFNGTLTRENKEKLFPFTKWLFGFHREDH